MENCPKMYPVSEQFSGQKCLAVARGHERTARLLQVEGKVTLTNTLSYFDSQPKYAEEHL